MPHVIVVMGVAGAGKTMVGNALAAALGWRFQDGDSFHSAANIEKMSRGHPLTDADRAPWLSALRTLIASAIEADEHVVLACSALKESYRRELTLDGTASSDVSFVFLDVPSDELARRLATRPHHFAPPSLLASQLETLERPTDAIRVDGTLPVNDIVQFVEREMHL